MEFSKLEIDIVTNLWIKDTKSMITALSEMTRREVKTDSYSFRKILANNVPKYLNPKELSFLMSYVKISGAFNGVIVIASTLRDILKLVDILLHRKIGYYKALDEENLPVVKELTNILQGYYFTSVSNIFGDEVKWGKTFVSTNAFRALEDFDLGRIYVEEIDVMMFEAAITVKDEKSGFKAVLLFKEEDIRKILDKLAQKIMV